MCLSASTRRYSPHFELYDVSKVHKSFCPYMPMVVASVIYWKQVR